MERVIQEVTGNRSFGLPYWDWSKSTGNNADPAIRLFGGDGDPNSLLPEYSCRTRGDEILTGCNCTVTQGPFAGQLMLGEWGLPLPGHRLLSRSFGCHEPSLPTSDVVSFIANLTYYNSTNYESFRPMVGGLTMHPQSVYTWPESEDGIDMHARVHRWLGGTMMGDYSPNDPMFFLHHSFVDLIFERWIRNGIEAGTYGMDNALPVLKGPVGHNLYECVGPFFPLRTHAEFFRDSRELGYTFDYFLSGPGDAGSLPPSSVYQDSTLEAHYRQQTNTTLKNTTWHRSADVTGSTAAYTPLRRLHIETLIPKTLAKLNGDDTEARAAGLSEQRVHTNNVAAEKHEASQAVRRAKAERAARIKLPAVPRRRAAVKYTAATAATAASGASVEDSASMKKTTSRSRRASRARAKRELAEAVATAKKLVPNANFP